MKLKLYWLHKLRAFKTRAFQKKNRSIAATSDHNVKRDGAIKNTSIRLSQDSSQITSSFIDALSFEKTPSKHRKPSSRLSQVVASLGCGSAVPLRLRKERHKPKVYSEEEDRLQAAPLAAFGGINQGFTKKGQHLQHVEDDYFFKEGCLDPHATTKRWVGACRCIQNVARADKGSTRSDEALISRKLRKELRSHDEQAKATVSSTESKLQNKGSMSKTLKQSLVQNAFVKEPHLISESKQMHFTKVEGSMSDRIVVDQRRADTEAKVLTRWSSASVRDYMNLKGNLTPGDSMLERSIGSISSSKERSSRTSYDERFRNASFERRRPQSITSVSTLSSYDFDRVSHWGSYDGAHGTSNQTNTGHIRWQGDTMEESNAHHNKSQRSAYSTCDPDASVMGYSLSDCEDDEEDCGLLRTVSYARAWLNRNMYVDDDEENDEDDDEYADCFIDLEANAKAWATAWALSSSDAMRSYKGSSSILKQDTINSHRSQRGPDAAALKRKYHKEFAGKQQAIVVSSHHEDNMNTFMFPPTSDQEEEMGANTLKMFDYTANRSLNRVDQEGLMMDGKRVLRGDQKGHSYHGLAVEKKSQNPYADFRDSMVDMVLQKQMYKSSELEELLQSFLCLNSLEHHDLIVQAFSEVWEKVFGSFSGFHKRP